MHKAIALAVGVILLGGCSSGVSSDDSSSSSAPSALPSATSLPSLAPATESPQPGASASPTTPAPTLPTGDDWVLVNEDLARTGAQVALDAAAEGRTVVASVLTEANPDDFDAGIVFSRDGGATWAWGGVVQDEGRTFPEAVLLDGTTAVIVGSNQTEDTSGITSRAFMAVAEGADFPLRRVDLPSEFDGVGVQLQDIVSVAGEWIVAGYVQGSPDADGKAHPTGVLWRSDDRGDTWSKQELDVPGATDVVVKALAIAPDGSWNLVGQVGDGDLVAQYEALWLRSTDGGRTFEQAGTKALTGNFDQGASRIEFSADGSVAILGWTEVTDDHGSDSALWVEVPGHALAQIGSAGVPVKDGNPSGLFIDGVMWRDGALVAWGSADGSYPMPDAQFWYLSGGALVPTAVLPGNGTPLDVTRFVTADDSMIGLGFTGPDTNDAEVGIWKATVPAP